MKPAFPRIVERTTTSRLVSLVALLAIAIFIGVVFFRVMAIFLIPMFVAVVLVIVFRPLHDWFIHRCRGHVRLAAGLTTAAILLIVLLPLALVLSMAAAEGWAVVSHLDLESMSYRVKRLRQTFDLELPPEEVVSAIGVVEKGLDQLANTPELANESDAARARRIKDLHRRAVLVQDWASSSNRKSADPASVLSRWSGAEPSQLQAHLTALVEQLDDLINRPFDDDQFQPTVRSAAAATQRIRRTLLGDDLVFLLRSKANPSQDDLAELRSRLQRILAPAALQVAPILGKVLFGALIMVVSMYFFLADGPQMVSGILRLSPLDRRYAEQLLEEFSRVSRAVVVATLLTAVIQGAMAGIGFKLCGVPAVFLLTVLTIVGAMIPFVGAAAVWVPVVVWLFLEGRTMPGSMLLAWGLVISTCDNFIKPWILHGQSKLHPLLALVSVLGGVVALGPIGVFVGPMAVVFLQVVLQMVNHELKLLSDRVSSDRPSESDEGAASSSSSNPQPAA